jgi:hypothetical protein
MLTAAAILAGLTQGLAGSPLAAARLVPDHHGVGYVAAIEPAKQRRGGSAKPE